MKRLSLFLPIMVLMISCGSSSDEASGTAEIKELELVHTATMADDDEWMLSGIMQLAIDSNENMLFADNAQHKIYYLSSDGELLQTFGGSGSGPGEFQWLSFLFLLDDDRLLVPDMMQRRLSEFRLNNGKWEYYDTFTIDDDPSKFFFMGFKLTDGDIMISDPFSMTVPPEMNRVSYRPVSFHKISVEGEMVQENFMETMGSAMLFSQSGGNFRVAPVPFSETELLIGSPNGYLYRGNNMTFNIDKLDANGEVVANYSLDWPNYDVKPEDASQYLENYEGDFRSSVRSNIPDIKPVLRQIRVSNRGEVWVQVHVENDEADWIILNEDGSVKGRVRFPENSNVQHIRDNRIYTIGTDEFDVPAILVYELAA